MRNPFRFGQIVEEEHFCNRKEEIASLEQNLAGGQSIVLYSPRRMGKSSLMARVKDQLGRQGLVVSRVDFYALNSVAKIVQEVASASARAVLDETGDIQKFLEKIATIFKRLRFKFIPGPNGSLTIEPEIATPVEVHENLADALTSLNEFLAKKGKRGVLIFDEFQEIYLLDANLEAEFRTIIQTLTSLSFAFLGSKAHIITSMFSDRSRPFYLAAKLFELGPIEEQDFIPFIKNRFATCGVEISDSFAAKIVATTDGHPDYTQRLCSHIFDLASGKQLFLDETLIDEAAQIMIRSCGNIFVALWESFTLRQQQVLSILAEHGTLRRVSSILLAPYDMAATSYNTALREMVKRGVVTKDSEGFYHIADGFFSRWIAGEREVWF